MRLRRDSWTFAALAREAWKTLVDGSSIFYVLPLVAVLAGITGGVLALHASAGLDHQLVVADRAGANVLTVRSANQRDKIKIGRRSCEALAASPDIDAAGLALPLRDVYVPQLGKTVPVIGASASLLPQLQSADAVVGSAITKSSALTRLRIPGAGQALLSIRGRPQPDAIGTNSAIVVPLSVRVQSASTCFVVVNPLRNATRAAPVVVAELDVVGGPVIAQPGSVPTFNPVDTFTARQDQFLPLVFGGAGGLISAALIATQGSAWAAYRLSGTSRRSLATIFTLLSAIPGGFYAIAGVAFTAVGMSAMHSPGAVALEVLAGGCAWTLIGAAASLLVVARQPTNLARDR
ncbi:hypothetical protein DEI97_003640 [Curtobacterium sp. MCLR17_032]|uniref:hypothetical protein n=1 Tax=Curtobacterium sp. MCLR17_032 TaxID=2175650 RepID=UPI000DA7425D|nr:hypothetical protein [Curtobacterium sp. MCLR17_032]WIE62249.1 hypothetical protein DEI97_003640 [Curtobacterium sp. MCLR17_032]